MGIAVRIPGANFTKFVDREFPHIARAVSYNLFGGDATESAKNRAPAAAGAVGTFVGVAPPLYEKGSVTLRLPSDTVGSAFETGISVANEPFTFISVVSGIAANQTICGTYHSGIAGAMLFSNASAKLVLGSLASDETIVASSMQFFAGTRNGTVGKIYNADSTGLHEKIGTHGATIPTNTYRVGPLAAGVSPQNATINQKHAANLVFKEALSAQEITDIYGYLKYKLAQRGVNIL